jgi:hypothetical protein
MDNLGHTVGTKWAHFSGRLDTLDWIENNDLGEVRVTDYDPPGQEAMLSGYI